MNRLLATLLCLTLFGCKPPAATPAAPGSDVFEFVANGSPRPIVAQSGGNKAVHVAAEELSRWLGKSTGVTFPILDKPPDGSPYVLVALSSEYPDLARIIGLSGEDPDAFAIETGAERLVILGNSEAAVSNGIFTLLREMGFRWYFPDSRWWAIPSAPSPSVALRIIGKPDYRFVRIFYGTGGGPGEWLVRNRMVRHRAGSVAHAWNSRVPLKDYFATNPEYFALVNGRRQPSQLCVGNAEMRGVFVENSLAFLRKNPGQRIVSVEPNDNDAFCTAPESLAIGDGSPSDQVFFLANETAKATAAEFPDAVVGVLAYLNHADPPSFPLERNMYVEVTTNLRQTSKSIPEVIQAFAAKGVQVGVMDYLSVPWWQWGRLGSGAKGANWVATPAGLADYAKLGVTGFTGEAADNWGLNGLTYYLISDKLWSVSADSEQEASRFFASMFEEAEKPIRAIFEGWLRRDASRIEYALTDAALLREAYALSEKASVRERVTLLGHIVAWNYLFHRLTQDCLEKGPEAVAVAPDSPLGRLTVWGARMSGNGMLDTQSLQTFLSRAPGIGPVIEGVVKTGRPNPLEAFGPGGEIWRQNKNREASWDEVIDIFVEMEGFAAQQSLAVASSPVRAKDLLPTLRVAPQALEGWKPFAFPQRGLTIPTGVPLVVWAEAMEQIQVSYGAPENSFNPALSGGRTRHHVQWSVSPYGNELEVIASGSAVIDAQSGRIAGPDGFEQAPILTFHSPISGACVIRFQTTADRVLVGGSDLAKRPCGIAPFLVEPGLSPAVPNPIWPGVPFFVGVPAGTKSFNIASWKLAQRLNISDSTGKALVQREAFGCDDAVTVSGANGPQILSIVMGTMDVNICGFPAVLSPTPQQTLMATDP